MYIAVADATACTNSSAETVVSASVSDFAIFAKFRSVRADDCGFVDTNLLVFIQADKSISPDYDFDSISKTIGYKTASREGAIASAGLHPKASRIRSALFKVDIFD